MLPEALETTPPVIEQPTAFILFRHPELLPILKNLYPEGEVENHYNFDSNVSFTSYLVAPPNYEIVPNSDTVNPLSSNGWILIFVFIMYYVGYVAYQHYSSTGTSSSEERPIITHLQE